MVQHRDNDQSHNNKATSEKQEWNTTTAADDYGQ
jgi:hypothetical protein